MINIYFKFFVTIFEDTVHLEVPLKMSRHENVSKS